MLFFVPLDSTLVLHLFSQQSYISFYMSFAVIFTLVLHQFVHLFYISFCISIFISFFILSSTLVIYINILYQSYVLGYILIRYYSLALIFYISLLYQSFALDSTLVCCIVFCISVQHRILRQCLYSVMRQFFVLVIYMIFYVNVLHDVLHQSSTCCSTIIFCMLSCISPLHQAMYYCSTLSELENHFLKALRQFTHSAILWVVTSLGVTIVIIDPYVYLYT